MATNYDKFEYDLLQADSLDDYFKNLDAGKNLLLIGGIQLDDLPAVKIGTPEAKDVREILKDLPFMLRNIKNSYLTVDLMPSGIAYDNTSLNNVLLIKLDIVTWFNLLYNTAKREDLVTSMAELAKARDKTEELNEKLTNYENKATNDALRDADEQLDNADNSTESSEVLDKLEHDNLIDHLGKASPQEDEQAKDGDASGSHQASASNNDDPSNDYQPTADNNAENQANNENDENSQDDTAHNDIKNPDDLPALDNVTENDEEHQENSQKTESTNNVNGTDNNTDDNNTSLELDNVTENDEEHQENSQKTESTNNVNGTDDNTDDNNTSLELDNVTENDEEHQENSQKTESTNNVNGTDDNTDGDNASSELDDLEKESLPHNVTNRPLSAKVQAKMAKQDDKLQQVKTAPENAKANINPESQANVPSVKMQTPPVQVTNSTGQDTQTQLLTKMMETLNLVLKRETKKDEEKQEPKAVSKLTPKERLAKFRSNQDQLIASMIAKQI